MQSLSEQHSQAHWSLQDSQPQAAWQQEHEQSSQEHAPPVQQAQPGAQAEQHAAASTLESVGVDMNSDAVLVARTANVETNDNMGNSPNLAGDERSQWMCFRQDGKPQNVRAARTMTNENMETKKQETGRGATRDGV